DATARIVLTSALRADALSWHTPGVHETGAQVCHQATGTQLTSPRGNQTAHNPRNIGGQLARSVLRCAQAHICRSALADSRLIGDYASHPRPRGRSVV